jgi:hypothetical protein
MRFHVPNSEMAWLRREPSVWAGLRDLAHTTRPGDIFEGIDATDPMPTLRWFASRVRAKTVARDAEPSGVATAES